MGKKELAGSDDLLESELSENEPLERTDLSFCIIVHRFHTSPVDPPRSESSQATLEIESPPGCKPSVLHA